MLKVFNTNMDATQRRAHIVHLVRTQIGNRNWTDNNPDVVIPFLKNIGVEAVTLGKVWGIVKDRPIMQDELIDWLVEREDQSMFIADRMFLDQPVTLTWKDAKKIAASVAKSSLFVTPEDMFVTRFFVQDEVAKVAHRNVFNGEEETIVRDFTDDDLSPDRLRRQGALMLSTAHAIENLGKREEVDYAVATNTHVDATLLADSKSHEVAPSVAGGWL